MITQKFGSEVFFFLPVGDLKVKILLVGKSSLAIPYAESRTVSRRQQQMKYRRKYWVIRKMFWQAEQVKEDSFVMVNISGSGCSKGG